MEGTFDKDAMFDRSYKVSLAVSATQAMTIIGKEPPDLIILDYDMPICAGRMMLQMIRVEEKIKDVPVIFLTGISDREHILEVLDLKPAGYFLIPPVYEQISEMIDRIL
ncbi:MAG: response regulator [Lachnospiraceae bacterium]